MGPGFSDEFLLGVFEVVNPNGLPSSGEMRRRIGFDQSDADDV